MRWLPRGPLSIRTIIGLMIGLMGLLGLVLALFTGNIHRNLVVENQRASLVSLIDLKITDLLDGTEAHARDLGVALQTDAMLRKAFDARDRAALERTLERQFHQYFVTANVLKLERLIVFDADYRLLAQAVADEAVAADGDPVCPGLVERARGRDGPRRAQVIADLCPSFAGAMQMVIVPLGGLWPKGYLAVVVDPLPTLLSLETVLGMPLRIREPGVAAAAFRSPDWPEAETLQDALIAETTVADAERQPLLEVAVANDYRQLHAQLRGARQALMLAAALMTLAAITVALLIFRNTTVKPLRLLAAQLRHVGHDRSSLLGAVPPRGAAELQALASDFNRMATELNDVYATLESMAFLDGLTGLPNRNRFHERLAALVSGAAAAQRPFALLLMDLDRFKAVNDTLGHHVGDELLREIGARLRAAVTALNGSHACIHDDGEGCVVARIGGDEFAALLSCMCTSAEAERTARLFLEAIEGPCLIAGHRLMLGASIGIACYPEHGGDVHTLMRRADLAMYHAKGTRAGYALYEAVLDESGLVHLNLEGDLLRAMDRDELFVEYQPQIDVRSGEVVGVEALVRWLHPEQGHLGPDVFIPVADKTGIIQRLTEWVLNRALCDCAVWQREGFGFGVSVNLSPLNLHHPYMMKVVTEALEAWQVAAASLTLELTESGVMADPEYAIQVLGALADAGVGISIDDFGTGHCSLSYIKKLPAGEIKIDRSFVADMGTDANDRVIVRSTIGLAHNMGLTVVAEGVEDHAILGELEALGCDRAQGYCISRPLLLGALLGWLQGRRELRERQGA